MSFAFYSQWCSFIIAVHQVECFFSIPFFYFDLQLNRIGCWYSQRFQIKTNKTFVRLYTWALIGIVPEFQVDFPIVRRSDKGVFHQIDGMRFYSVIIEKEIYIQEIASYPYAFYFYRIVADTVGIFGCKKDRAFGENIPNIVYSDGIIAAFFFLGKDCKVYKNALSVFRCVIYIQIHRA